MISYKEKPDTKKQILNILHPYVKNWFFTSFKDFSLPQLYGVMEVHNRNNVLVSAPTGSGKTLTAFLSILNELIDASEKNILEDRIYCLYISPLKALSRDIKKNLLVPLEEIQKVAGNNLNIRVGVRTGDTTASEKAKMLKRPPHILITTPESAAIMISSMKFKEHFRNTEWLIIDEIHALAENKRGTHLSLTAERLAATSPHLTRVGLSATISPLEEIAKFLVGYNTKKKQWNKCNIINMQFIKEADLRVLSPAADLINISHKELHHNMYKLIDKLIQQHRTTLVFSNTRSATERVVHHLRQKFPKNYIETDEDDEAKAIGAHHGSLGKEFRQNIEDRLKKGKLKAIVSSTSLELGLDIGYIDLVICLGSPKSVARVLQRAGRAGHKLHEKVKARIIVLDRDDLIECSVMLKAAIEKKIDNLHIPTNCLDVLAQQIFGIAVTRKIHIDELFTLIKQSYAYHNLKKQDFMEVIDYLAGKYVSLEDRYIYAKIWHDEETGMIGRKGRLARVMYMTNIGTIPDNSFIEVKIGKQVIGHLDEAFLERLRKGDIFVLGGNVYKFKYSRGMTAQVSASAKSPPTVPSWFSEMLPLSFDLSLEIGKFRRLIEQRLKTKEKKRDIIAFIQKYLYLNKQTAEAVYNYCRQQFLFAEIPHDKKIIIEEFKEQKFYYYVFHTLYGRRVNDALSRAVALAISRIQHRDVRIGMNDNGFYILTEKPINAKKALEVLKSDRFTEVLEAAIDRTDILTRRFRHCATRALMILRSYKGKRRRVGRRQMSSQMLINTVKRIDRNFCILKEAKREVFHDLMDAEHTVWVLQQIEKKKIKVKTIKTPLPSPFSFNLISQGHRDTLKIEDRVEFLRRMHNMVLAKIGKKYKI